MDTNRPSRCRLAWIEVAQLHKLLDAVRPRFAATTVNLVTAARRSLFTAGDARIFPAGFHEPGVLELAEDRIHRATWQTGGIHDVESVQVSGRDRLQDLDSRVTQWPIHD